MRCLFLLLAACGGETPDPKDSDPKDSAAPATIPCADPGEAIATDIDETLTTDDAEWIAQLVDGTHDPAMRPDANTLMHAYADLGYAIIYVTARGETTTLSDGRSAREASEDWLVLHDFPYDPELLFLAETTSFDDDATVAYKAGVIDDLEAGGLPTTWAYGNADTDILAFQQAGIPDDHIFLVGELAGEMGVNPIPNGEAYTAHLDVQLPLVATAACND